MSYDLVGWSGEEFKESLVGARTIDSKEQLTVDLAKFCKTAILKEDGVYIYDADSGDINDEFFIINGWRKLYSNNTINVKDFGAKGDSEVDDTEAFEKAIEYLKGLDGGTLYIPSTNKNYKLTRSIKLKNNIKMQGEGYKSFLKFYGNTASLTVDADIEEKHIAHWGLESLRIAKNDGSSGAAITLKGDGTSGTNHAPIRFMMRDIDISSSAGYGMDISNSYIGNFYNLNIRNCAKSALKIKYDEKTTTVAGNALSFFGGEFQQNGWGIDIEGAVGINFYGLTIEGNKGASKIKGNSRDINFIGGYQEGNGKKPSDRDFIIGGISTAGAVSFLNVVFWNGSGAEKNYAIEVFNSQNLVIDNCTFNSYKLGAIVNAPKGSIASVKGLYRNSLLNGTPKMCEGENKYFRPAIEDVEIMENIEYDFQSVSNGKTVFHDFIIDGAQYGSFVNVAVNVNLQLLQITAQVIAVNKIRVTLSNITGKTINIGNAKFYFVIRPVLY